MPVLTQYRHGSTMGIPPSKNVHQRAMREAVGGWTDSSTRRNTRFLFSVIEPDLGDYGLALTLTLRDCPPTAVEWKLVRETFFKRLRRLGLIRAHWLTEWQRRGVPHLHAAVWLPAPADGHHPLFLRSLIVEHWLAVASPYGAGQNAQHVAMIEDSVGWFQYLSKHAVRGLKHYQRNSENIPFGWKTTGRMWGHLGQWPLQDPIKFRFSIHCYWAARRIVQRWRLADARSSGDLPRLRSARRMLQSNDRASGSCRGVSEWIGQDCSDLILQYLAAMGHKIRC